MSMMKNFFKHRIDEVVGVYFDGATLSAVELRLQKSDADISRIVENDEVVDVDYVFDAACPTDHWVLFDTFEAPFDEIVVGDELDVRAEKIAEKISVLCSTRGWSTSVMALCLNRSEVVIELDDFSNVPATEIANAVRYRIATAGNFDIDGFYSAHIDLNGRTWMEGIAKADAQCWIDAWRKNEMNLTALTAMPDELNEIEGIDANGAEVSASMARAIWAARSAALKSAPNFLVDELERRSSWDFRKFAAAAAAIALLGLTALFGVDRWHYHETSAAFAVEKRGLDELERERRLKNFIESDLEELNARRELMADLSKEVFPWRSVLIHFGVIHVKGVWLDEIRSTEDKSIEIRGEALSYEAMSEYIKTLEADREFFRREPQIVSSRSSRSGSTVEFVVRLSLL